MVTYENYSDELAALTSWLENQPHLPKITLVIQKTFIHVCGGDIEKTKSLIELHYSMRSKHPHIFIDRDPSDKISKNISEIFLNVVLPDMTPEGNTIYINRFIDPDPEKFNYTESIKLMIMQFDSILVEPHPSGNMSNGVLAICDMKGYTFKHIAKYNLSTLRIFMKYAQEGAIIQIKQLHLVNVLPIIDKLKNLMKPFMNSELVKKMHYHKPNSETLFDFISKELIPIELGGNGPSIQELHKVQKLNLLEKREYLKDKLYWQIDETKRSNKEQKSNKAGSANFNDLNVD